MWHYGADPRADEGGRSGPAQFGAGRPGELVSRPVAPAATIPGVVERAAGDHAGRRALVEGNLVVTFDELLGVVRDAAKAMIANGVRTGDRVALWAPNTVQWAVASLAVLFAGGWVVPVNTRSTPAEVAELVVRARCRLVLAEGNFMGRSLAREASGIAGEADVVCLGEADGPELLTWPAFVASAGRVSSLELDGRLGVLSPDDVSHVQYTSGTTGLPKGVMLCHRAMVETTRTWAGVVGLVAGDRYPVVSPFSHISGHKTGLLACLTAGAQALPVLKLDLDRFEQMVADYHVTVVQGPPTLFDALVEQVRDGSAAYGSLRAGVTGAAVIPPGLVRDMKDVLGLDVVVTAYGLTECTGVCTMTRPGDPVEVVAETSGRPIPGVEVDIIDESGSSVSRGTRGQIAVRGVGVMRGYLDDANADQEDRGDGWLATGDVGWVGGDGNLRIVDRLKDMVVVGGFNVYPAEVERVLLEHEAVSQVAVVGLPDERMGEVPAAFVVARHSVPESALVDFCRERLATFKVPRSLWLVDRLPLNESGKVSKAELRAEGVRLARR